MTEAPTLCKADLYQFTGTEQCYRHALVRKVLYTDGVKYVADKAGAYAPVHLPDVPVHLPDLIKLWLGPGCA